MAKDEQEIWINSIQDTISKINSHFGLAQVSFIFRNHNAKTIEDLDPSDLPDVFSEIHELANNL